MMRNGTKFSLLSAAILSAALLMPGASWATTTAKNCPKEPAPNVAISSGMTYSGTNCVLNSVNDVDSFVFTASKGDIWSFIEDGASPTSNVCLDLWSPSLTKTHLGCTSAGETGNWYFLYNAQTLSESGSYTIDVTATGGTISYNLSLERLNPVPPDASLIFLPANISSEVSPPTAQEAYKFYAATTGVYQITASVPSPANNVCFAVYKPGGSVAVNSTCTSAGLHGNWYVVTADMTPTVTGTYLLVVSTLYDVGTVNYSLGVSCAAGTCPPNPIPPTCVLKDALSYNATTSTLTMNFTLATPVPATWDAWLISNQNVATPLWSQSEPISDNPVTVPETQANVPKEGIVGVLSTLTVPSTTTTAGGITCSSWTTVNTGKP
ncbi:MAG TPA: hypothetical protein VK812_14055 [Candidatus Binatus sp.]|jgi:hypothetical protein|nr:hypothetical protein [Candidatus Binatus sp.]